MSQRFTFFSTIAAALSAAVLLPSCAHTEQEVYAALLEETRDTISPQLQQLGARNWVVIADPTYPIPAGTGVQTMVVSTGSLDTFREVLDLIEQQGSLTPRIWINNELEAITDNLAPGIENYSASVNNLVSGRFCYRLDERIISSQVAEASHNFRVLFIKTPTQLPYSSIAIELDSGYWDSDSETEIRERLAGLQATTEEEAQPATKDNSNKKRN